MTATIAEQLVATALGDLSGTVTVWLTYRRGVQVGEEFRTEVHAEEQELEDIGEGKDWGAPHFGRQISKTQD